MTDQHAQKRIAVSDHAVLRYMERVMGFNVEGVRQRLLEKAQFTSPIMPKCIRHDDCVLVFATGPDGAAVVVTVCGTEYGKPDKRGGGSNPKIRRRILRKVGVG